MPTIINLRSQAFIVSCFIIFSQLFLIQINKVSAQCDEDCNTLLNNTFIGFEAGLNNTTGNDNTFVGEAAGKANTGGSANSFYGVSAGVSNQNGLNNSFFGRDAGRNNTSGSYNSFFGRDAGRNITSGSFNTFFGESAGEMDTTGRFNSFFGYNAGKNNTQWRNSFFGDSAGKSNTTGFDNCFFGQNAGESNTTGRRNSSFGQGAGINNTTGDRNTFLGQKAGEFNETGSSNTFIGSHAGSRSKGSGNVFIGHGATPNSSNEDVSYRLYIDVDGSTIGGGINPAGFDKPLIYGEFDNDFVRINGTFEVTAGLSNPSSQTLKEDFVAQDAYEILNKLTSLEIAKWNYKERPNEKHIGPVAEEFYALFGLGSGDKTISTIDADGVMMLAIQALKDENEQLKSQLVSQGDQLSKQEEQLIQQENLIQEILKGLE